MDKHRIFSAIWLKIIIYCVADLPSILYITSLSQILGSQLSLFWGWWCAWWALSKIVWREYWTPIHVQCKNTYWSKVYSLEFWYILSGLNIQLEQSKNENSVHVERYDKSYTVVIYRSIRTYGLVVKAHSKSGAIGSIPAGCWNSLQPFSFAQHWANQWTDKRALVLLRSLWFVSFEFRMWRSRADRFFTLNMKIGLPLFWSTWSGTKGQDSALCVGVAYEQETEQLYCLIAIYPQKAWPLFSMNCWKHINGPHCVFCSDGPLACVLCRSIVSYALRQILLVQPSGPHQCSNGRHTATASGGLHIKIGPNRPVVILPAMLRPQRIVPAWTRADRTAPEAQHTSSPSVQHRTAAYTMLPEVREWAAIERGGRRRIGGCDARHKQLGEALLL